MSVRYGPPLIAGSVVYGDPGLGVLGSVIRATTATGPHGAGLLYNDWDAGDDDKEFRALIVTPPASGTLSVNEDGSFTLSGATDGTYTLVYRLFVDGVDLGTATATFNVGIVTYRPGVDVSGSWSAVGAASVAAALFDESESNYGESPNLSASQICTWDPPLPAGTWNLPIIAERTATGGQVRIVCLDAGDVSVGATAWQALTNAPSPYNLAVTTSATATQFRIEVQP